MTADTHQGLALAGSRLARQQGTPPSGHHLHQPRSRHLRTPFARHHSMPGHLPAGITCTPQHSSMHSSSTSHQSRQLHAKHSQIRRSRGSARHAACQGYELQGFKELSSPWHRPHLLQGGQVLDEGVGVEVGALLLVLVFLVGGCRRGRRSLRLPPLAAAPWGKSNTQLISLPLGTRLTMAN